MRQIPSEGELCGVECVARVHAFCQRYERNLEVNENRGNWKRLPACLRDKPQVLTLEERELLVMRGRLMGIKTVEKMIEEAHDEHS